MTVDEGVDITKAGDRGVLKRIIREGEGSDTPTPGCQVTVHYTGTLLDGTKFDSSKDRNEPFEFNLGKGSVIKAWDIGVATMKKGEVCVLRCAPQYAYGAAGSPPKIPPDAVLQFEIEMLKWELEDLSPTKNKSILRQTLQPGAGYDTPNDAALVTVELEGRVLRSAEGVEEGEGRVFDSRTVTFSLGEGSDHDVPEGVERALEKFLKGERSRLTLQPKYGFRSEGNKRLGVPADAVLQYTVRLDSFERAKEPWAMEPNEKLDQAHIFKQKGTDYYKANKNLLAIKMYKRVVSLLEKMSEESAEEAAAARALVTSAHLNLALVYLKGSPPHYHEARLHADKALQADADNVKGLFRRGQALLGLKEPQLALNDFQRVLQKEPNNKAAGTQAAACRASLGAQRDREKQLYRNMFDKFAHKDTELEKILAKKEEAAYGARVGEWGEGGEGAGEGEGEWTDVQRARKPTHFEKENPNILMLDKDGQFSNM